MEELKNELQQVPGPEISGPKLYFGDTWQRALRLWLHVDMHNYFLERSCSYQALTESAEPQSMQLEDNASVVFLFGLLLSLFPGLAPLWFRNPLFTSFHLSSTQDALSPMGIVFSLYNTEKKKS